MAKVRFPLHSLKASGQLGDAAQFRQNRYGTHVFAPRPRARQNQRPASPAQQSVRDRYQTYLLDWRALDQFERAAWNELATREPRQVSGWNLYLASRMTAANPPSTADWDDGTTHWDDGTTWD